MKKSYHFKQRFAPSKAAELCTAAVECETGRGEREHHTGSDTARGGCVNPRVQRFAPSKAAELCTAAVEYETGRGEREDHTGSDTARGMRSRN